MSTGKPNTSYQSLDSFHTDKSAGWHLEEATTSATKRNSKMAKVDDPAEKHRN